MSVWEQFKCVTYPGFDRVEFNVCLYTRNADIVVEFQRRRGGSLQYQSVFNRIRDGMVKRKLVSGALLSVPKENESNGRQPRPFGPLPVVADWAISVNQPASNNALGNPKDDTNGAADKAARITGVDTLLSMAANEQCATVAQEASGALAMLSSTADGLESFNRPEVLSRIVGLLRSNCNDVQVSYDPNFVSLASLASLGIPRSLLGFPLSYMNPAVCSDHTHGILAVQFSKHLGVYAFLLGTC